MKRLKYLVLIISIFIINVVGVKAADFTSYVTGNTSLYEGQSTTITFGVKNSKEIYGLSTAVKYDSSKLEVTGSSGLSGFTLSLGSSALLDSASGRSGSFTLFSITFKAKSSFVPGESTTVSFTNVEATEGEKLYHGTNASAVINMLAPKSSNNNFKYIKLDGKDLDLSKSSYSVTVENSVGSVNIEADKEDSKASISGTGTKKLSLYSNKFSVVVTAENGSKKTYTITVIRKDEEGNTSKPNEEVEEVSSAKEEPKLSKLGVDGYTLEFDPTKYQYNIKVDSNTEKVNITYDSDSKYTVKVDNPSELVVGENLVTITVTDKDGNSSTYKIVVFKPEKDGNAATECKKSDCNNKKYIIIMIAEGLVILSLIGYIAQKAETDKKKKKEEEIVYIKE